MIVVAVLLSLLLASVPVAGAATAADLRCESFRSLAEAFRVFDEGPVGSEIDLSSAFETAEVAKLWGCDALGRGAGICTAVPAVQDPVVKRQCCFEAKASFLTVNSWVQWDKPDKHFSLTLLKINIMSALDSALKAIALACPLDGAEYVEQQGPDSLFDSFTKVPGSNDLCESYRVGNAAMRILVLANIVEDSAILTLHRMRGAAFCRDSWPFPENLNCQMAESQVELMDALLATAPVAKALVENEAIDLKLRERLNTSVSGLKESVRLAGRAVDQLCE